MQGKHDPADESIINAISSIIFLSTPHRGTNLAETLNRILQVSPTATPMQFIAELASGSQTLQKLNEQFRHVAPKLDIVSFYETCPTPLARFKQIVCGPFFSFVGIGELILSVDLDGVGQGFVCTRLPRRGLKASGCGSSRSLQIYQPI